MDTEIEIPTLLAYTTENQAHVWCQYCLRWHRHGLTGGHRLAHCVVPESPYKRTGYTLEIKGPWTAEHKSAHKDQRLPTCRRCHHPKSPAVLHKCR